ncbi:hypothetical protein ACFS5L_40175 [Streptomyces phyllanthi]|uniref:hypothetical protein n=1 Tax=Streptomyces phyllanthi TaxID=1803180 RepID=UPI001884404D|nr:hypothetical protein [Streptomyces phyllanthi]
MDLRQRGKGSGSDEADAGRNHSDRPEWYGQDGYATPMELTRSGPHTDRTRDPRATKTNQYPTSHRRTDHRTTDHRPTIHPTPIHRTPIHHPTIHPTPIHHPTIHRTKTKVSA